MSGNIIIRDLKRSDIDGIADIHVRVLNKSFLGKLGYGFIKRLYTLMTEDRSFKCFVAEHGGKAIGYIGITDDSAHFYSRIYKKNFILLAAEVIRRCVRFPMLIIHSFAVLVEKGLSEGTLEFKAEILSVAVEKKHRSRGIGKKLVAQAVSHVEDTDANGLFVIVNTKIKANIFYEFLGFEKVRRFVSHGDLMNLYVLKLRS